MHRAAAPARVDHRFGDLGVAKAPATNTPGRLVSSGSNLSVSQKPYLLRSTCMCPAKATALGGGSLPTDKTHHVELFRRSSPLVSW
jgi:hypothetical protein